MKSHNFISINNNYKYLLKQSIMKDFKFGKKIKQIIKLKIHR